jgi:ferredoxin-NADP reductase
VLRLVLKLATGVGKTTVMAMLRAPTLGRRRNKPFDAANREPPFDQKE